METSNGLQLLSQELSKLPGIGQKTATRLAYYLLNQPEQTAENLAGAIVSARKSVRFCRVCQTLTDREVCPICSDDRRDRTQIMVVETPQDLEAYERTGSYKGVYHVLHGVFSPMRGINLSEIRYKELLERVAEGPVSEVIVATGSSLEGETTAVVINNEMSKRGIRTTRIASGIPVGVDLENTDSMTLSRALEDRRAM
ncbi:MAG: recombination protein RecR [Lachnospiraceae bacterium]|nr:recombination protein RecR [Lachnospiraceae bacterium]